MQARGDKYNYCSVSITFQNILKDPSSLSAISSPLYGIPEYQVYVGGAAAAPFLQSADFSEVVGIVRCRRNLRAPSFQNQLSESPSSEQNPLHSV